jgi:hypothetical protein
LPVKFRLLAYVIGEMCSLNVDGSVSCIVFSWSDDPAVHLSGWWVHVSFDRVFTRRIKSLALPQDMVRGFGGFSTVAGRVGNNVRL